MRRILTALIFPWFFPVSFIFCAPIAIIGVSITGNKSFAHKVARVWASMVLSVCGIKVKVRCRDNSFIKELPVIFACNHASQMDIPILYKALPVEFRFLVKKELFKVPLLGYAMKKSGYIPIDRKNSKAAIKSMKEAAEQLKTGASIVIFPEGTRSINGKLQSFKEGGFMLAVKSGRPVVPVGIKGSHNILKKGSFIARPGVVEVEIGSVIRSFDKEKRLSRSELSLLAHKEIKKMLNAAQ